MADVIIFAVKPQTMRKTVIEISENKKIEDKLILSVAAGIKIQTIEIYSTLFFFV